MEKISSFVKQFNNSDNASINTNIRIINTLSTKQKRALLKIINSDYKKIFNEMRKKGEIK